MSHRKMWRYAAVVLALGALRMSQPAEAVATQTSACGLIMCGAPGCSDADWQCFECPGYDCTTETTGYCAGHQFSSTIYCWAHAE